MVSGEQRVVPGNSAYKVIDVVCECDVPQGVQRHVPVAVVCIVCGSRHLVVLLSVGNSRAIVSTQESFYSIS